MQREMRTEVKKVQKNAKKQLTSARHSCIIHLVLEISLRSVAQLGSARALGAWGRGFKSLHSDHFFRQSHLWPRGQEVKTPPFHGDNRGSIPLGVTIFFFFGMVLQGPLAQWSEQAAHNRSVRGSKP